jgi:NitT/TauT family transport system permease protein
MDRKKSDQLAEGVTVSVRRGRRHSQKLQLTLFSAALVMIWEFVVRAFNVPDYLLPAPSAIAKSLYLGLASGLFVRSFFTTLLEAVLGFLIATIAGVVIGTLIAEFKVFERLIYPYVVALQSVPKIAIAPLIIVWLGYGLDSKIVMSATIAFFPVLVNVIVGLKSADQDKLDLMRSLKASRWQQLTFVRFPTALPFIFAGLDVAVIFSVLGAIVAEFVGSEVGLGHLILAFNFNLDIAAVFACLLLLSAMGMTLHAIIQWLQKRMIFWSRTDEILKM